MSSRGGCQVCAAEAGEAAIRRALTVIERAVAMQTRLINQLPDTARIASGKFHMDIQRLDILAVINATVDGDRTSARIKRP